MSIMKYYEYTNLCTFSKKNNNMTKLLKPFNNDSLVLLQNYLKLLTIQY